MPESNVKMRTLLPPDFHPVLQRWWASRFGEPTAAQIEGWRAIRRGEHTLIAAPTGSGKTLAAFLTAIDAAVARGPGARRAARRGAGHLRLAAEGAVRRHPQEPGRAAARDPTLAEEWATRRSSITAAVRSGDTPQTERAAMLRTPPHILVTTPESLYLLLTAERSREMLKTARVVIVDEIHAVLQSRRGAHLALSLERLDHVCGRKLQRIGLSATQKPIEEVARFLTRRVRASIVDRGHKRTMDLAVEVPRLAARSGDVARGLEGDLRPPGRADRVASHDAHHGEHAAPGRAHGAPAVGAPRRRARRRAPRQPFEGGAAGRRGAAARGQAQGAGGHRVARARHRHRPRRSRLPDLVAAPHRDASAARRPLRPHHRGRAQGPHLPAHARRPHRMRGDGARGARRRARPRRACRTSRSTCSRSRSSPRPRPTRSGTRTRCFELLRGAYPYRNLEQDEFDEVVEMLARGYATRRGRRARADPSRRRQPQAARAQGLAHDRDHERRRDPRGVRLPRAARARRALHRHAERGLRHRIAAGRRVPARQHLVAHPAHRQRRGARRRRAGPAAVDAVLAGRGAGAQRRDERGGLAPARGGRCASCPGPTSRAADGELGAGDRLARAGLRAVARRRGADRGVSRRRQARARRRADRRHARRSSASSTSPAACSSCCTRRSAAASTAPGASRCARSSARASTSSCRRRRPKRASSCRSARRTRSRSKTCSATCTRTPCARRWCRRCSIRRSSRRAGAGAPRSRSRCRATATARACPNQLQRMYAEDLLQAVFPDAAACLDNIQGAREVPGPSAGQSGAARCAGGGDGPARARRSAAAAACAGEIGCVARDTPEPSVLSHELLNSAVYTFLDDAPLEERRTRAVYTRRATEARSADDLGALDPAAIERVREEAWPVANTRRRDARRAAAGGLHRASRELDAALAPRCSSAARANARC